MCRPVSPPTLRPRWTKHRHHTAHSQKRLHCRPPGWAVDPRRRKQRAQRGFRLLLTLDWGRASEWTNSSASLSYGLDRTRCPKPSPRAAPRQLQKRHSGGWTRGRLCRKPTLEHRTLSLAAKRRLHMMQAQAHNAPTLHLRWLIASAKRS